MWASVADQDRAIRILKDSFVEGRLTFDEFDERVGRAMEARGFKELLALYDDLPVGLFDRLPAHPPDPRPSVGKKRPRRGVSVPGRRYSPLKPGPKLVQLLQPPFHEIMASSPSPRP